MQRITKAFVLGAGLGKRLRPLSEVLPKPLMPIFHKPLITFALDHLSALGVESFVINSHHLAKEFESFFSNGSYAGRPVQLVYEPNILETGGGIKNAEPLIGRQPFIVYSGDILTDFDLDPLIEEHFRRGNDVTLALRVTGMASGVILDHGRIVDITKEHETSGYDYANVSVWNPGIFDRIALGKKISFIPVLLEWIRQGGQIGGVVLEDRGWFNIGSRAQYLEVHRTIAENKWRPFYLTSPDWPKAVAETAMVDPSAKLIGGTVVGAGCRVGAGAILTNTILWPGSQIASQSELRDCIVRSDRKVEGVHCDRDI
jgi:NDP-sugar pyrophosphorylase family protein